MIKIRITIKGMARIQGFCEKCGFTRGPAIFLVLLPLLGWTALANEELSGGETTVFIRSSLAFSLPADNLPLGDLPRFFSGNALFNTNWVSASSVVDGRDGLGPLFNARSCSACHFKDGRGRPPGSGEIPNGLVFRIGIPGLGENGGPLPDSIYGNQVSVRALPGEKPEARIVLRMEEIAGAYPDGKVYSLLKPHYAVDHWGYGEPHEELQFSPRVASPVFGLGLLDAIGEAELEQRADPDDRDGDGISGRINRVWSRSKGSERTGRYGWKANKAELIDQIAAAFVGDIGITTSLFPEENHSAVQAPSGPFADSGSPELPDRELEDLVFYLKTLGVPASRIDAPEEFHKGKALFESARCSSCHTPEMNTDPHYPIPALAGQTIRPYTDLLLHDMGEALSDGRRDFQATGREWRTPPLWGIGLLPTVNGHSRLLHDGRARNVEEAILWHGGEAEKSKGAFKAMSAENRQLLIAFVESL